MSATEQARAALAAHRAASVRRLETPVNFFVKKRSKTTKNASINQPVWTKTQYDKALKKGQDMHRNLVRRHEQNKDPIRTAKDTHLGLVYLDEDGNETTTARKADKPNLGAIEGVEGERGYRREYGRHQDEEMKRVMEVYIFCLGDITPSQIRDILDGLYNNGSYNESRGWVMRYRSGAQNTTLSWFTMVLTTMMEYWGGGDLAAGLNHWDSFSEDEQGQFLIDRLEEAPEMILGFAFQREANSINFAQIWCHHDQEATKNWRFCVRTKFLSLAHAVIDLRLASHNGTKLQQKEADDLLFDYWKVMMTMPEIDEYELGTRIETVPTYASRSDSLASVHLDRAAVTVKLKMANKFAK